MKRRIFAATIALCILASGSFVPAAAHAQWGDGWNDYDDSIWYSSAPDYTYDSGGWFFNDPPPVYESPVYEDYQYTNQAYYSEPDVQSSSMWFYAADTFTQGWESFTTSVGDFFGFDSNPQLILFQDSVYSDSDGNRYYKNQTEKYEDPRNEKYQDPRGTNDGLIVLPLEDPTNDNGILKNPDWRLQPNGESGCAGDTKCLDYYELCVIDIRNFQREKDIPPPTGYTAESWQSRLDDVIQNRQTECEQMKLSS